MGQRRALETGRMVINSERDVVQVETFDGRVMSWEQFCADPRQAENIRRRRVWRNLNNTSGPKEDPRPGDEAWLRSEWREQG